MGAVLERPRAKGTTVEMGSRALVGADGGVTELDMEAYEAALNAAMGVLDSGRLPFTRNGDTGRRLVDVVDVMDYQRQERERMRSSLVAMRRAAQEIAMDDAELAEYVAQFD